MSINFKNVLNFALECAKLTYPRYTRSFSSTLPEIGDVVALYAPRKVDASAHIPGGADPLYGVGICMGHAEVLTGTRPDLIMLVGGQSQVWSRNYKCMEGFRCDMQDFFIRAEDSSSVY